MVFFTVIEIFYLCHSYHSYTVSSQVWKTKTMKVAKIIFYRNVFHIVWKTIFRKHIGKQMKILKFRFSIFQTLKFWVSEIQNLVFWGVYNFFNVISHHFDWQKLQSDLILLRKSKMPCETIFQYSSWMVFS